MGKLLTVSSKTGERRQSKLERVLKTRKQQQYCTGFNSSTARQDKLGPTTTLFPPVSPIPLRNTTPSTALTQLKLNVERTVDLNGWLIILLYSR
jgi:hypothetical protein